jgi:3-oxoacyl-[acyl-carrier-protein] synthase III
MPRCCAKRPHLQFARSGASEVQLKAEDVDLIVCATYYFQQICWNKVILRAAAFNLQADRER